jgi:hypothetical protein
MDTLYPRCAGLDVHKDSVVAAVRLAAAGGVKTEVRSFDTTTPGLLALSGWLAEQGCTHVAMEATGVYWKPVWHILADGDVTLILANAAHVKNVPGRKSDVADAMWLSDLLAHGLIRASFVPEPATQAMRALLRTRKQLVREQASHVQRLQKTLEDANIKLSSVLASVVGLSGRDIIKAIIAGESDPDQLLILVHRGSFDTTQEDPRPYRGGSPTSIASCCVCIYARSMRSMPRLGRLTWRWTMISTLFARRSACCARIRA